MIVCDEKALYFEPVMWVFELIKKAYGVDLIIDSGYKVEIGLGDDYPIQVSSSFYEDLIQKEIYDHNHYFKGEPLLFMDGGKPDYISTVFYLVNGFQEYRLPVSQLDKYGRMDFAHSFQSKFDALQKDLVKEYINKLLFEIDPLLTIPKKKSRLFISHDIDSVYGSLKYDGLWALRKGNIPKMLEVITQTVLNKPPWFNIDKVVRLEDEYDIKACYYWIVENGRSEDGIKNGDYRFESEKIQNQLHHAKHLGNEMGLHKSTMKTDFRKELAKMEGARSNRFHFLKIENPASYSTMEESGILSDSSIGFPYHMGFKNSFGMPFYPYCLERKAKFDVLEIPLQIMDGMFDIRSKQSCDEAFAKITNFIEANNTNAIISILWHNSEMTNFAYEYSFECYKKLLHYFSENDFESVLPSQLVKEYESS